MKPDLLVLAAGIGSRYGGLKQMDGMGPHGEVILDYSVHDALQTGFGRVVLVVRRELEDDFRERITCHFEDRVPVHFVYQELDDLPAGYSVPAERQKPWGTGHAIMAARETIDRPFAVINGDDFYGRGAYAALADFLIQQPGEAGAGPEHYAMVGYRLRNTLSEHGHVARGVCSTDDDGFLREVVEHTHIETAQDRIKYLDEDGAWREFTGDEAVSLNLWGFTPSIFGYLEDQFRTFLDTRGDDPKAEFFIPTVVDQLIKDGEARVSVLPTEERWIGVTYPDDKPIVVAGIRALIDAGLYPEKLWG